MGGFRECFGASAGTEYLEPGHAVDSARRVDEQRAGSNAGRSVTVAVLLAARWASSITNAEARWPPRSGEKAGSACGIRTRDLRLERAVSWATRRMRRDL